MRLFIAIEIPEEIKDHVVGLQNLIKTDFLKATYPKCFHLTLLFLGDIDEDRVEDIKTKLRDIRFDQLNLTFDNLGVFPNQNYIRVVWLGIKETELLTKLAEDISAALRQKPDKRFHPHITLARVKHISEKEKFKEILKGIKTEPKCFKVSSFKLIMSTLQKEGPIYDVLEEFNIWK